MKLESISVDLKHYRRSSTLDANALSFMSVERVMEPKSTGCHLRGAKEKKRELFSKQQLPLDLWWELRDGWMERKGYCPL